MHMLHGFPGPHGFPSVDHGWPHPFPWHPGIYPHGPPILGTHGLELQCASHLLLAGSAWGTWE